MHPFHIGPEAAVYIEHPSNTTYAHSQLNISITAFDSLTSISTVTVEIKGENLTLSEDKGVRYNYTYDFTDGTHTMKVYANDTNGNRTTRKQ